MKLYRLVSEAEVRDIEEAGCFRHPYGGLEVKEFWLTEADARGYLAKAIRQAYTPPYVRLFVATLQCPLDDIPHLQMELDGRQAITVSGEALYRLNRIITLKWVNLDSND